MTIDIDMQKNHSPDAVLKQAVATYGDMVYGAALRQTGDGHMAADITQGVFVVLARRAASGKLPKEAYMAGWLLKAVYYGVKEARRAAARRAYHERHAAGLRTEIAGEESAAPEAVLAEVDAALMRLGASERELVVRRHLHGEAVGAIAAAIHLRENTVGRRIARALDKMRRLLARRGVIVPAATLGAVLSAEAARSAPGAVMTAAKGAATGPSVLADLILRRMFMVKIKLMAAAVVASVAAAGAGGVLINDFAFQSSRADAATAPVAAASAPASVTVEGFGVTTDRGVAVRLEALVGGTPLQPGSDWWNADGSSHAALRLPTPVMAGGGSMGSTGGNGQPGPGTCTLYFDITQGPDDSRFIGYRISSNPAGSSVSGSGRSGRHALATNIRGNPETADFLVELTAGPWTHYVLHAGSGFPVDADGVAMQSLNAEGRPGEGFTWILDNFDASVQRLLIVREEGKESIASLVPRGKGEPGYRYVVPGHPAEQFLAVRPYTLEVELKNVALRPGVQTKVETVAKELPDVPVREDLGKFLKVVGAGGDIRAGLATGADASAVGVLGEFRKLGEGGGGAGLRVKELWVDGARACAIVDQNRPARGAEDQHLGLILVRSEKQWRGSKAEMLRGDEAVSGYVRGFCNVGKGPTKDD